MYANQEFQRTILTLNRLLIKLNVFLINLLKNSKIDHEANSCCGR